MAWLIALKNSPFQVKYLNYRKFRCLKLSHIDVLEGASRKETLGLNLSPDHLIS